MVSRTLPGRAYTDPARLELEIETILRPAWHCVGRADELAAPGDFLTVTILDEPVLLVRGDDGELRALSNICRHRGMPVADGAGSAGTFSCPYHGWSYATDGELRVAPFTVPEAVTDCRLPSWPLTVDDHGFVHVAVTTDPAPLRSIPGLVEELAPFRTADMCFHHCETEIWGCNWKAMVENFMEGSHLSVVHQETLHPLTPTRLASKGRRVRRSRATTRPFRRACGRSHPARPGSPMRNAVDRFCGSAFRPRSLARTRPSAPRFSRFPCRSIAP